MKRFYTAPVSKQDQVIAMLREMIARLTSEVTK